MKALVLAGLLVGSAILDACAQGWVNLDNVSNTDTTFAATSNGLFWLIPWGIYCQPGSPMLITHDFNASFYAGTDSANLTLLKTISGAAAVGDNLAGPGTFIDPAGDIVAIPGATTSAFFRIDVWLGNYTSYAAAYSGGGSCGTSGVFMNPVARPPNAPPELTGMPAVQIWQICPPPPPPFIDPFRISIVFDPTAHQVRLSFFAQFHVSYYIWSSTDLKTWNTINSTMGNGYLVSIPFSIGTETQRFYRVTTAPYINGAN